LHVHFINLDRSPDRLAEFKSVNSHLASATRVPAIEEHRIDIASLAQQGLVQADILSTYRIGALCQALSHRALWVKAAESATPVTIADDDAIFNLNFNTLAADVLKSLPPDWDVILWGWNFDAFMIFDMLPGVSPCVAYFDQDKMRLNTRTFREMPISPRAHKLIWSFGHTSYTVSPKGGQLLASKCFPLRPMMVHCPEGARTPARTPSFHNIGLDLTLDSVYRDINAFICIPPLVISTNEHAKSTIQPGGSGVVQFRPAAPAQPPAAKPDDVAALTSQVPELHKAGRFDEVLAVFDKVLALNPNSMETHYNRATVLGDLQRFDEALAAYDRVLALKPDVVFALNNRGWVLQKLRRYQEALASYEKALAIDPNYAAAKDNRDSLLRAQQQGAG
jgi:glycosyl transferase family 25